MRFLSLFSGIEAATQAWAPLGWECVAVAEIEKFPCAVLAHHYPDVPNLGDVTKITEADIFALGQIDLVVFGSPCQDLSIAGKRKGFTDDDGQLTRSGLFHVAINIVRWARVHGRCRFALWENVPGAFSSNEGRDFAAVVMQLAGLESLAVPPKGWGTEGCAVGTEALVEWAVLDAQWFGVAQRRRRVFALADFGDWTSRPPILLEPDRLRGDRAPCREAGQTVAPTISARTKGGGGLGTDFDCDGGLLPVGDARLLRVDRSGACDVDENGLQLTVGTLCADTHPGAYSGQDAYTGRLVPTLAPYAFQPRIARNGRGDMGEVVNSLTAQAGETGKGDAAPCVAYAIQAGALRTNPASGPDGVGVQEAIAYTLEARAEVQAVAFSCKDHGADAAVEVAPTLRAMTHSGSHANAGGQLAVCFAENSRAELRLEGGDGQRTGTLSTGGGKPGQGAPTVCVTGQVTHALKADGFDASEDGTGRGQPIVAAWAIGSHAGAADGDQTNRSHANGGPVGSNISEELAYSLRAGRTQGVATTMAVRRLTPRECERLQGVADDHTLIPWTEYQRMQKRAAKHGVSFESELRKRGKILRGPTPDDCPDGPRYKALGNSMAVVVMSWIGRAIEAATWPVWE
jgi:DNA (cytosine-5)-methyltransferase 1